MLATGRRHGSSEPVSYTHLDVYKRQVLARYLVQDYQFCDPFTALLGQGCASAPALPERLVFARQLGMFADDENTYLSLIHI